MGSTLRGGDGGGRLVSPSLDPSLLRAGFQGSSPLPSGYDSCGAIDNALTIPSLADDVSFLPRTRGIAILLLSVGVGSDFFSRQGGTHSPQLGMLASQPGKWCRAHAVEPRATYLPGEESLVASSLEGQVSALGVVLSSS